MNEAFSPSFKKNRPIVCVQGLGFVGLVMAVAVANAQDENQEPFFNVIGVELPHPQGLRKVEAILSGKLPIASSDEKLRPKFEEAVRRGNLTATVDTETYSLAETILVDIPLDVRRSEQNEAFVDFHAFKEAIISIGKRIKPNTLIIIETTVPPGTCEKIVAPELKAQLSQRGLPGDAFLLAHAYERVMPGKNYYDSIVNFWRVYAGHTEKASEACKNFLSRVINVEQYPLFRLSNTRASETAKILENSYRAVNIAFMEEWGRFAESIDIDLFEVLDAIRVRETHSNIRQPGFGVGGYCLTKDPLFAPIAAKQIFGITDLTFPFCNQAVEINHHMPLVSLRKIKDRFRGDLRGKKILLCGVSYRPDIGDTRYSPSQTFVEKAREEGAEVVCHDPFVPYWNELDISVAAVLPSAESFDIVIFAVPHGEYALLDFKDWLKNAKPVLFDANQVLSKAQRKQLTAMNISFDSIGRGPTQ